MKPLLFALLMLPIFLRSQQTRLINVVDVSGKVVVQGNGLRPRILVSFSALTDDYGELCV